VQPAGGIENDHVVAVFLGVLDAVSRDLYGVLALLAIDVDFQLLTQDDQLIDCGRSLQVIGDQKRLFAFRDQVFAELGGGCRFAATLEAG